MILFLSGKTLPVSWTKHAAVFGLMLFITHGDAAAPDHLGARPRIPFTALADHFPSPDMIYGPFTFWFWDCPLEKADAPAMARAMTTQRLNPGYAHGRMCQVDGPDLPRRQWLSPQWFDLFGRTLAEAEKAGCYFSYCDEYWWPSGRAAGRVLKAHPDLWAVSLKWETLDATVQDMRSLSLPASFFTVAAQCIEVRDAYPAARKVKTRIPPHKPAVIAGRSLQLIGSGKAFEWIPPIPGRWRIYSFSRYYHPGVDGGRLNYLDRRVAKAFIALAHQPYADHFGNAMGRSIPGVFVDNEGDYGYKLAWSADLARHYRQKTGRDIRLDIPLLVDRDREGRWAAARWAWFDCVSDIYSDCLGATSRWLEARGMYCISNLWEESLMWQAAAVGDFFKAQRAYSMPGTDCLGLSALKPHDFKETQSVAEFEGRRFQSEVMGAAGWWGFNPVSIKKVANAITAWGVSHVVPHGIFMTRKLDRNPWLPDWHTENPWWPYLHHWTDFVRRASYINSHGHACPDVLLLSPMDSVWALSGPGVFDPAIEGRVPVPPVMPMPGADAVEQPRPVLKKNSAWWCPPRMNDWFPDEVKHIDKVYSQAIETLTQARIEFLTADRHYLGQMTVVKGVLLREPFQFKTVVLPPLVTLPLKTAAKLVDFARSGGWVYALGDLPAASTETGMNDPEMAGLMAALRASPTFKTLTEDLAKAIDGNAPGMAPQTIFESGPFPMIQQHRIIQDRHFFWLVNNTGQPQNSVIRVKGATGRAFLWDCENGAQTAIPSTPLKNESRVALSFGPVEAFWLVFDPSLPPIAPDRQSARIQAAQTLLELTGPWQIRIDAAVQPPLENPFKPPAEFSRPKGNRRPLADWRTWGLKKFSGIMDYQKRVELDSRAGPLVLDLGNVAHAAEVWVNGQHAGSRLWPPFTFDITAHVLPGRENRLKIRVANLVNNSYNQEKEAGLLGPVVIKQAMAE